MMNFDLFRRNSFVIGVLQLMPVAFKENGGTNHQLVSSVELLQANNIAINVTDDSSCNYLQDTVTDWIAANAFEKDRNGNNILHLLSLVIQPVRCEFQTGADGLENDGIMSSTICRNDTITRCVNMFSKEMCIDLCQGWGLETDERRLDFYVESLGIRPSSTFSSMAGSNGTYSDKNGEIIEAYFSVSALFDESLAVKRS